MRNPIDVLLYAPEDAVGTTVQEIKEALLELKWDATRTAIDFFDTNIEVFQSHYHDNLAEGHKEEPDWETIWEYAQEMVTEVMIEIYTYYIDQNDIYLLTK